MRTPDLQIGVEVNQPIMEFKSHVAGKNADVRVFQDRIEWGKKGRMSTGAKAALGAATGGISLFATGVRGKAEDETIFVRSITSVTSKKSGFTKNVVSVIASGNTIDFRCEQSEAVAFKKLLNDLVAGVLPQAGSAPQPAQAPPPVPSGPPQAAGSAADEVMGQIQKLDELKQAGILSDDEFQQKKTELLGRL